MVETIPRHIQLNGEPHLLAERATTVARLLVELGLDARMVAVERNRQVVKRARYGVEPVDSGDEVEIVSFVGGG